MLVFAFFVVATILFAIEAFQSPPNRLVALGLAFMAAAFALGAGSPLF